MSVTKGTLVQKNITATATLVPATTSVPSPIIIPSVTGASSATVSIQVCAVGAKPASDDIKVYIFLVPGSVAMVPATFQGLIDDGYCIEYATVVNPGDLLNRSCDVIGITERFYFYSTGADINIRISGVVGL